MAKTTKTPKRPRGRPRVFSPDRSRFFVRLEPDEAAELKVAIEASGESVNEWMRSAVRTRLDRAKHRPTSDEVARRLQKGGRS